jgi:hypothetical protein
MGSPVFVPRIVDRICYEQMAIVKHNSNGLGDLSGWLVAGRGRPRVGRDRATMAGFN